MTHAQQAEQLAKNALAMRIIAARECKAIDREHDYANSRRSTTGVGSNRKDKATKYYAPTIHDYAQQNPIVRELLRKTQAKYLP